MISYMYYYLLFIQQKKTATYLIGHQVAPLTLSHMFPAIHPSFTADQPTPTNVPPSEIKGFFGQTY